MTTTTSETYAQVQVHPPESPQSWGVRRTEVVESFPTYHPPYPYHHTRRVVSYRWVRSAVHHGRRRMVRTVGLWSRIQKRVPRWRVTARREQGGPVGRVEGPVLLSLWVFLLRCLTVLLAVVRVPLQTSLAPVSIPSPTPVSCRRETTGVSQLGSINGTLTGTLTFTVREMYIMN